MKHAERKHATFSASGSSKWYNCAASIRLEAESPPEPESPFALEGTKAHELLDFYLKDVVTYSSCKTAVKPGPSVEIEKHVWWALGELKKLTPEGAISWAEQKVDMSEFTHPGEFGTLDYACLEEFDRLTIVDFKYGAGVAVDPEDNTQLICYALGMLKMINYSVQKVRLVILQPRARHDRGPVRIWEIDTNCLLQWRDKLKAAHDIALRPGAPAAPGHWCRFCKAKTICPALYKEAAEMVPHIVDPRTRGFIFPKVDVRSMSAVDRGAVLEALERLETWGDAFRAECQFLMDRGQKIPGWKLVPKRGRNCFDDPFKMEQEARKYLGEDAFDPPSLKTPAQLETVIKAEADPVRREKLKKWFKARVSKISSGVNLVKDSAPGESTTSAIQDFADIPIGE